MIYEGSYKNRPAVIVEGKQLIATILPQDGGKMASLRVRNSGKELLVQGEKETYQVLTYDGNFETSECSGFDDMFPTVDPYTPEEGEYKGMEYPDHGEMCRLEHTVCMMEDSIVLTAMSKKFPIQYKKTVEEGKNGDIDITYTITNLGDVPFEFLWAGHIMLQGESGMEVNSPFKEDAKRTMMFGPKNVPEKELPLNRLMKYEPGTGSVYKIYYDDPMNDGSFGISYSDGSKLNFAVDADKTPYLGVWFGNGMFRNLYGVILEPCTVPYDAPNLAKARGYTSIIPPKSSYTFPLHISWINAV